MHLADDADGEQGGPADEQDELQGIDCRHERSRERHSAIDAEAEERRRRNLQQLEDLELSTQDHNLREDEEDVHEKRQRAVGERRRARQDPWDAGDGRRPQPRLRGERDAQSGGRHAEGEECRPPLSVKRQHGRFALAQWW